MVSPKCFLSHPHCPLKMARLGVERHAADAVQDLSITGVITAGKTQTVFFFSVSLFFSSAPSANPSNPAEMSTESMVGLNYSLALGTSYLPLLPILWRSKELLHKVTIGASTHSEIINIHGPSVMVQRLMTQTVSYIHLWQHL